MTLGWLVKSSTAVAATIVLVAFLSGGLVPAAALTPQAPPITDGINPPLRSETTTTSTTQATVTSAAGSLELPSSNIRDESNAATIVFIGTVAAVFVIGALVVRQTRTRRPGE